MKAIEIKDLSMTYRKNQVLDQLNLSLDLGHIVGLLGPNGAGKTTLLKILAGLEMDYKGQVQVLGQTPGPQTKKKVSFQPDYLPLPKDLTAAQAIGLYRQFYENFEETKAFYMLDRFHLEQNRKIREMSKGMRDKLQIALTLARKAQIYLLDEPIGGVDPASKQEVIDGILDEFDPQATLVLSSHMVRDIEPLIDRVIMINEGKVLMDEETDALRTLYHQDLETIFKEVYHG
ncbi:MAG: ABC transporter ATP-binding protein [Tissierellia bacterium]|nr:ABC transporter ATP-binding protein [Tissierellia bacterium]